MTIRATLEGHLNELSRARAWSQILATVDRETPNAAGADLGWLKYQRGLALFSQTTALYDLARNLFDEAIALLDGDLYWKMAALVGGAWIALFRDDITGARRYWRGMVATIESGDAGARKWFGRERLAAGYIYQREAEIAEVTTGKAQAAILYVSSARYLRESMAFYSQDVGPYDERDQQCQLRIAETALAETLWYAGQRAEALRVAKRVMESQHKHGLAGPTYWRGMQALFDGRCQEAVTLLSEASMIARERSSHRLSCRADEALCEAIAGLGDGPRLVATIGPLIDQAVEANNVGMVFRLQRLQADFKRRQEGRECSKGS